MDRILVLPIIVLAIASFGEALYSLRGGWRLAGLFRSWRNRPPGAFAPPTTLVVPCRGVDAGMEENLRAFFRLDYPDLQILLVTESDTDPSVPIMRRVLADHPDRSATILFAGIARQRGQKVHNLVHALQSVREQDEVLAFGDSDIRPEPEWLRYLVAPLECPEVGASTGFRWYLPELGGAASVLRSVWNAGIVGLMTPGSCPFAWGGAMAVRRTTFASADIEGRWQNALSDDYAASRAIQTLGLAIRFQPRCLSFTHEDCSLGELLSWSYRQLAITRVYHPSLWTVGLASEVGNNGVFWGGVGFVAGALVLHQVPPLTGLLAVILGATYLARCLKAWIRWRAVLSVFAQHAEALRRYRAAYVFAGPVASLITLLGLLRSLLSTDIEWRGIRYRMVSPTQTEVVARK